MADIAVKPILLNDIDLTIGADNYAGAVSRAMLTPTVPTAKWKGMRKGSSINIVGEPDWVLELTFAQDFETAKSLSQRLLTDQGKAVDMTLAPAKGGLTYKVSVVLVPGAIGGDLGESAATTSAVSLPVNGQPTPAAAA